MSVLTKIRKWIAQKIGPGGIGGYEQGDVYNAGFGGMGNRSFGQLRERQWLEEFESNCHLRAPFARLAEDLSLVPWKLQRHLKNGKKKEIKQHRILTLLKMPDPTMTGMLWFQTIQLHFDLVGEFFLWIEFGPAPELGFDVPICLHIIPPHWVINTPFRNQVYFTVQIPGRESFRVTPDEMIWHRRPRPANPYTRGLGIAQSMDQEITQLDHMNKYNSAFFRNGATVGTVLGVEGLKDWERFQTQFEDRHQGAQNAFRTAIVSGKVTASNLSTAHKDLDYNAGVKLKRNIVRETIGAPPEIFGQSENSNRATAQEADHLHQSYGLLPRMAAMAELLNCYLVPLFGEPDLVLEYENPVKETLEAKLSRVDAGVARGTLTINDWLQEMGMDPRPDGDVYLIPVNVRLVKAGDLTKTAEIEQKAAELSANPPPPPPPAPVNGSENGGNSSENAPQNGPDPAPKPEKILAPIPGKSLDHYLEALEALKNGKH